MGGIAVRHWRRTRYLDQLFYLFQYFPLNRLILYFIPEDKKDPEVLRQYKLVVAGILLTSLFVSYHALFCVLIKLWAGFWVLTAYIFWNLVIVSLIRKRVNLTLATNFYVFGGVTTILVCAWYSGGFHSTVVPMLATSPFVALLLAGRKVGFLWLFINSACTVAMGIMSFNGYVFPMDYDTDWKTLLDITDILSVVTLTFFVGVVFENGRRTALKKLHEQNLLLAEEKKKTALYEISQELHDNIGQILSLVKINLHTASVLQGDALQQKITTTLGLVAKAMKDVREISHNLNSENIIEFDLVKSIEHQLEAITHIGTYTTHLTINGKCYRLKAQTEFIIFRVVQEILNNVIKHAQASNIDITLLYHPKHFLLTVADNGIGINSEKILHNGQGVRTMRSRIEVIGGVFGISSQERKGTTITIQIPTAT
jgi:signal transduction histidine kinase